MKRIDIFVVIIMLLSLLLVSACGKVQSVGKEGKASALNATSIAVPAAPSGVASISERDRITIKWNPSPGATTYNVYFSDKPGNARTNGEKISGITSTSYEQIGINQKTMYYYIVTASNERGESPPSAESGTMAQALTPQSPDNVAALGGNGRITLKWKEVQGASSYTVYYATNPGISRTKGKKIEGVKSSPYLLADVKRHTMYFFTVTAVNDAGESSASNETGAMPD